MEFLLYKNSNAIMEFYFKCFVLSSVSFFKELINFYANMEQAKVFIPICSYYSIRWNTSLGGYGFLYNSGRCWEKNMTTAVHEKCRLTVLSWLQKAMEQSLNLLMYLKEVSVTLRNWRKSMEMHNSFLDKRMDGY